MFFRRDEEDEAKSIASALEKLGVKVNPTNLSAQYENSSAIRPRHYELWLAPDAL